MDIFGLCSIPNYLIWTLVILVCVYWYSTWPYGQLKALGIPHDAPWPLVGNMAAYLGKQHFGVVDLNFKKKYGNVFGCYEGSTPSIVSFDKEILKQFLVKDFSSFTDRREMLMRGIISHSVLDVCGDRWRKQRILLSAFFTTSKIKQMVPQMHQCTDNLMNHLDRFSKEHEAFDVKRLTSAFAMDTICLMSYGIAVNSLDDTESPFLKASKLLVSFKPKSLLFFMMVAFPNLGRLLNKTSFTMWPSGLMEFFVTVVGEAMDIRQQNPGSCDFIELMMKAHKEDLEQHATTIGDGMASAAGEEAKKGLTRDEIVANSILFILAGYDTVSTTLSFFLFNMANNQDCQERLYQEIIDVMGDEKKPTYEHVMKMTYLEMCVSESMRTVPSIFRLDRRCVKDTTIKGIRIPKGTLLVMPVWSLHHDPDLWAEPEKFDPERFHPDVRHNIDNYMYMPFGAGPRNCVGMRLAQVELKMAAIETFLNFRLTVAAKMQMPMELENGFFPMAKGGLWLDAEARN